MKKHHLMYVDVDLSQASSCELINALEDMYLDRKDITRLREIISNSEYIIIDGIDKVKLDLIKDIIEKYSLVQLQGLLYEPIKDTKTLTLFDFAFDK